MAFVTTIEKGVPNVIRDGAFAIPIRVTVTDDVLEEVVLNKTFTCTYTPTSTLQVGSVRQCHPCCFGPFCY